MIATRLLKSLSILIVVGICGAFPSNPPVEKSYKIIGYQQEGDAQTLILRFEPSDAVNFAAVNYRQPRQEEDEDVEEATVPSTTPFIPAIIPGITKIFTGILTGNLNEIFHGSTSFAPQNVSHAIDTVYNQVVGLPAPMSTPPPIRPGSVQAATAAPAPPPTAAAPTQAPQGVGAGQPLVTAAPAVEVTTRATSNEDDEDESEGDAFREFEFRKARHYRY